MADMKPECVSYRTAFCTYDGRHHVLGGSMLSDAYAHLRSTWPEFAAAPCVVRRAKFSHKTGCDGEMTLLREGTAADVPAEAAFTALGEYGDKPFAAWFMPDDAAPVTRDLQSRNQIESIEVTGEFAGRCRIACGRIEDFVLLLVDANKHVQLSTPPLQGQKWVSELVSIEKFVLRMEHCPLTTDLSIENLANRSAADRIFTLNRLSFSDSAGKQCSLDMGFSFFPEQ